MAYRIHSTGGALGFKLSSFYAIGQPWVQCDVRKPHRCEITADTTPAGAVAWRPITNAANRMHRISEDGMRQLVIQYQTR